MIKELLFICSAMSGPYHTIEENPTRYLDLRITDVAVHLDQYGKTRTGLIDVGKPEVVMDLTKWSVETGPDPKVLKFYPLDEYDFNAVVWEDTTWIRGDDRWVKECEPHE
jgi:hypothetical protein